MPGAVPGPDSEPQAPHVDVSVLARGMLHRRVTRMYVPDADAHATDPVLASVPPARRDTLIATHTDRRRTLGHVFL